MPSSVDAFRYDVPFVAPAIPYPPEAYNAAVFETIHSAMRLYFNQLDNALRSISMPTLSTSQTGSYTTTGEVDREVVIMANASPATVTLRGSPKAELQVIVKRATGSDTVTIDTADALLIDGSSSITLVSDYDAVYLLYTPAAAEWSIISEMVN
jgi:hypothetical protein